MSYKIWVVPEAWKEMKKLPGNMRHRVRHSVNELEKNPYLSGSKELRIADIEDVDLWRLRIENIRVIYAVSETEKTIDVLAVRKRPPYDYEDLEKLLEDIL